MRKFMILAALVALVVSALAIPALAQGRFDGAHNGPQQGFFSGDRFDNQDSDNQDSNNQDGHWWDDSNWWNDNWWNDNHNNDVPVVSQDFNQEAQSGDVSQSFNVSGTGDNSNQCVGITGNANTGNAQNQIGVIQYGSEADDFGFFDSGASLNVSGNSTTTCDQQVNQAAAAG